MGTDSLELDQNHKVEFDVILCCYNQSTSNFDVLCILRYFYV